MNETSTWTAPRNPMFRKLWTATVISGTSVAAHDNAGTWMMNDFTGSPFLISLMSTLASLPFFVFTLLTSILSCASQSALFQLFCVSDNLILLTSN